MIVGKKKFNYGEVTTEPIYEGLAVAANGMRVNNRFGYPVSIRVTKLLFNPLLYSSADYHRQN